MYSIREKFLIIPVFPKQKFLSQFLIKQNQKGVLTAKTTVEPSLNPKQRYYLTGSLDFFAVKVPLCLCLMRNCEGNFQTEEQKTENRRVFGCAFPKVGTGNSDDSGMSLEK